MKANLIKHTVMAGCLGSLMWGSIALADGWPSSVVGEWYVAANRSIGNLTIESQASSGQCQAIVGTISFSKASIVDNIKGFYCPGSGRIGFARRRDNTPIQFFVGNVSMTGNRPILAIGGTFINWDNTGGSSLGEYNFTAGKNG